MPSLNWLGKDKVVAHDLDVPYHSLKRVYIFNAEESEEANNELENMLIHGDNLLSLKALSELLGVAYTQIRNPDSNLSLLGRS